MVLVFSPQNLPDCGKIKKNLSLGAKIEKVNSAAKILGPVERKHSRKLSARKPFEFAVKKEEKTPTVGANLFVHLQGGRDLVARDLSGFSDPYVVIELGKKKFKSKRTPQTLFPRWNEVFAFEFPTSEDKVLHFTVMDWDRLTKDDFMGEFSVDVSELELDQPAQSEWIPLEVPPLLFRLVCFCLFVFSNSLLFISRADQGNRIKSQGRFNCS